MKTQLLTLLLPMGLLALTACDSGGGEPPQTLGEGEIVFDQPNPNPPTSDLRSQIRDSREAMRDTCQLSLLYYLHLEKERCTLEKYENSPPQKAAIQQHQALLEAFIKEESDSPHFKDPAQNPFTKDEVKEVAFFNGVLEQIDKQNTDVETRLKKLQAQLSQLRNQAYEKLQQALEDIPYCQILNQNQDQLELTCSNIPQADWNTYPQFMTRQRQLVAALKLWQSYSSHFNNYPLNRMVKSEVILKSQSDLGETLRQHSKFWGSGLSVLLLELSQDIENSLGNIQREVIVGSNLGGSYYQMQLELDSPSGLSQQSIDKMLSHYKNLTRLQNFLKEQAQLIETKLVDRLSFTYEASFEKFSNKEYQKPPAKSQFYASFPLSSDNEGWLKFLKTIPVQNNSFQIKQHELWANLQSLFEQLDLLADRKKFPVRNFFDDNYYPRGSLNEQINEIEKILTWVKNSLDHRIKTFNQIHGEDSFQGDEEVVIYTDYFGQGVYQTNQKTLAIKIFQGFDPARADADLTMWLYDYKKGN